MLAVRPDQLTVFEDAAVAAFAAAEVERLSLRFAPWCVAVGSVALRATVDEGIRRAEAHGMADDASVAAWLDLALLLGSGFADDPLLPWARLALDDAALGDPEVRLVRVDDCARDHLARIGGADGSRTVAALERIRRHPWSTWSPRFTASALEPMLAELYPEKHHGLASSGLIPVLLGTARTIADRHHVTDDRGRSIITVMVFMLGSAFDDDPQFPWAEEALRRGSDQGGALLHGAKALLDRLLLALRETR